MNNKIYVDATYKSINKYTEELCGDRVEIVRNDDCCIVVLSDGLGSGVKANILSTLTSKIISTMMEQGASIEDTVDTVVHTLPVCSVRKVAYSTFSIMRIGYDREVYLAEFDSPSCIYVRNGELKPILYKTREIAGKKIKEARFKVDIGDMLTVISDGVVYAGIGALLNLGWSWENVSEFVAKRSRTEITAARLANLLAETCNELYMGMPGDDTTVASVKIVPYMPVNIFTGPPKNPEDDERVVEDFISSEGIKIVAGGSSANIISRILGEEIITQIEYLDPDVPPIGAIKGVDLVTEGVLTLKKALDILKSYFANPTENKNIESLDAGHGASKIAKILAEQCTHVNLFVGRKINPAHQNPNMPMDLSIRLRIVEDLCTVLRSAGKVVTTRYY